MREAAEGNRPYTKILSEAFIFWSDIRNNPYDTVVFDLFDIYGKEYDVCEKLTRYIFNQALIGQSDVNYISYIYKSHIPVIQEFDVIKILSDDAMLNECVTMDDFFLSCTDKVLNVIKKQDPYLIDNNENVLYTSREYEGLTLNISGLAYKLKQARVPVWNMFDDLGDLVSLRRLPFESNYSYRNRIRDVFLHLPGNNFSGLVNAVSREINKRAYIRWHNTLAPFVFKDRNVFVDTVTVVYPNGSVEYPDVYTDGKKRLALLPLPENIAGVSVSYVNNITVHDLNDKEDYFVKQYYYNKNKTAKKNLVNFARDIRTNTYEKFIMDQTYRQPKASCFLPSLYDGSATGFKAYNHKAVNEIERSVFLTEQTGDVNGHPTRD